MPRNLTKNCQDNEENISLVSNQSINLKENIASGTFNNGITTKIDNLKHNIDQDNISFPKNNEKSGSVNPYMQPKGNVNKRHTPKIDSNKNLRTRTNPYQQSEVEKERDAKDTNLENLNEEECSNNQKLNENDDIINNNNDNPYVDEEKVISRKPSQLSNNDLKDNLKSPHNPKSIKNLSNHNSGLVPLEKQSSTELDQTTENINNNSHENVSALIHNPSKKRGGGRPSFSNKPRTPGPNLPNPMQEEDNNAPNSNEAPDVTPTNTQHTINKNESQEVNYISNHEDKIEKEEEKKPVRPANRFQPPSIRGRGANRGGRGSQGARPPPLVPRVTQNKQEESKNE